MNDEITLKLKTYSDDIVTDLLIIGSTMCEQMEFAALMYENDHLSEQRMIEMVHIGTQITNGVLGSIELEMVERKREIEDLKTIAEAQSETVSDIEKINKQEG